MFKQLKISGFHYDKMTVGKINEVYYVRDDNEDDSILIVPDVEDPNKTVLIFYVGCQIAFVTTFIGDENLDIETYIDSRISKYFED